MTLVTFLFPCEVVLPALPAWLTIFLFTLLGFGLGAIPFSLYLTRWAVGIDIRQIADGNPGATNAWRAAGWRVGLLAYFLDISKAVVPVLLAVHHFGVQDWGIVPVGLAPTLGHAFSPLLKGRGGKGLATILGVWIGVSLVEIPLVILLALVPIFLWLRKPAVSVLLTAALTLFYLFVFHRDPTWMMLLLLQTALVIWTHRQELSALIHSP